MDILPSHLHPAPVGARAPTRDFRPAIAVGVVTGVIWPDDPKSVNKKFPEYRVLVSRSDNNAGGTFEYPNCLVASKFGGIADLEVWTPRGDPQSGLKGKAGLGSKVLIACLDGSRHTAVIIGGLRDDADATDKKAKDFGHRYLERFNGTTFSIDNEGVLTLRRDGPTTADGKPDKDRAKETTVGAEITLDGTGGVQLADRAGDEQQHIRINHPDKKIEIRAESGWEVEVHGGATIHAGDGVTITASGADVAVTAEKGNVVLSAPAGQIKSGVNATEPTVMGTQFASWLVKALTQIAAIQVVAIGGVTSPPINAPALLALAAEIPAFLSQSSFVQKAP